MTPRETMSFNQLEQWLDDKGVTEIECLVPDLTGVARGKILPREKFTEDRGMRLPELVVAMGVTGVFPEEGPYFDIISPTDHDMHLRPDPSTVRIVPWAADPTAQVIHDCYDRAGGLIPYAPRSVLRRVCELYEADGLEPVVAPEIEFYLVARNADPDVPLKPPVGRSGRSETSRQAYSIDAVNEFDPLFEDVYDWCDRMELNVDTLIHEIGAGQMEINFFHAHPLGLADEVFLFKRTLREAALRHDMYATFMAKPIAGEPGSSMHVHQSVIRKSDGRNLFSNEDGSPSAEFHWFIGGLQRYIPACMALFAPYVNSYRRLARTSCSRMLKLMSVSAFTPPKRKEMFCRSRMTSPWRRPECGAAAAVFMSVMSIPRPLRPPACRPAARRSSLPRCAGRPRPCRCARPRT